MTVRRRYLRQCRTCQQHFSARSGNARWCDGCVSAKALHQRRSKAAWARRRRGTEARRATPSAPTGLYAAEKARADARRQAVWAQIIEEARRELQRCDLTLCIGRAR